MAEARALRRSIVVFKKGVDPATLVTTLYSNELLTPHEKSKATQKTLTDEEKLDEIFKAVDRRVSASPDKFRELVKALRSEPSTEIVADKIQGIYDELKPEVKSEAPPTKPSSTGKREARALRRSNAVFKKGVDPATLVTTLYCKELLTPDEKSKAMQKTLTDEEKLEEMFKAIERRVNINPDNFHELVKALRSEPSTVTVADKIQGIYDELKPEVKSEAPPTKPSSTGKRVQLLKEPVSSYLEHTTGDFG